MACPHVAGLAAQILANEGLSPTQLKARIVSTAHLNLIDNPGTGSPNRLAYSGCD